MRVPKRQIFPENVRQLTKYSSVVAALMGVAAVGFTAQQHIRRPKDLRWLDHVHVLPHPTTSNFRVVDGIRIHYQEQFINRNSEVVILLHGFCSSTYTWKDCFTPLVEAGYRVIALDLKGFGFSEKPPDLRYNIKDQINIIIRFMDSLGIKQATLVGNSYGGAISMACALKHPDRVKKLVLIAPAHNNAAISRRFLKNINWMINSGGSDLIAPLLVGSTNLLRYFMNKMFYDKSLVTSERYNAYLRPLTTANCQMAAITTLRQWQLEWIAEEMNLINFPTLIIWGEQDWALPVEWGAEIHFAIARSQFIVIPNCGHLPQEELPHDTCKLILDFCSKEKY
ncbi:MAG: alpha/beta hydrolase [Acidobacteria bacterium]|nr:alpha/beta hydrolase [Acidobacteriota bacterium]